MKYNIRCKYYSLENDYVDIGDIDLPDKPRPGEVIWIENETEKRIFVVIEVIRQFYKSPETQGEVLSNDIYVHEVMYAQPERKLLNG